MNRRIGKFDLLNKLGRGGMADVYLALDRESQERVALKLIEHGDGEIPDTIEAERGGAALQAQLAAIDPHVVRIYETDDADGYFFVSMEYVEGEDLAEAIRRGPLPPLRAAEIAEGICEALDHAHMLHVIIGGKEHRGVVHGDIKPRNIRIDTGARVRVLDFGIAKALSLSRRLTRNEFGSVPYASPERLDTGDVDASSDLWSLGVVLYEMLAGAQPFTAESTEKLERRIRGRAPAPEVPGECPEALRRIVRKALDPDAARRYQTARDFAADLAAFREGRPVLEDEADPDATRRTFPREEEEDIDATRRTAPAKAPEPAPPARSPARRNVRRAIGYLLLGFLLYMLYAVGADYLMWRRGQELAHRINAEELTDPDQIWTEWSGVAKERFGSLLLYSARKAVRQHLVAAADRVISSYRYDGQAVYENDWKRARGYLARALSLDSGDDSIRGKLRLCEGHIDRINGTARRNQATLSEAVEKFNEAQQLMPHSPDPQLGLARVYAYGLRDPDRLSDTLNQAGRHGYKSGNREKSQLADSFRDRGDRLWWDSRNIRGLPQEKDQIKRAAEDYRRALELYQGIVPYADASSNIVRVQNSLMEVETRLKELEGTNGSNPQ